MDLREACRRASARLRGAADVAMMQATDFGNRDDRAERRWFGEGQGIPALLASPAFVNWRGQRHGCRRVNSVGKPAGRG